MRLSAPIYQLKRRAKLIARDEKIALHEALNRVAREEGYAEWSLLSSQTAMHLSSKTMLSRLADGDMLLVGARPGHGKTLLGLRRARAEKGSSSRSNIRRRRHGSESAGWAETPLTSATGWKS